MNRRQFGAVLAALGVTSLNANAAASVHIETLQLSRNGWMPNNERLPVLLYRRAFQTSGDAAAIMEDAFRRNSWPPQWRNGVYDFHHYHSTAHEVLGFAAGRARLLLGGEGGHEIAVEAGDVAVLPTGTGHCRLEADPRFLVIGAYPANQHWDICRTAPTPAATERMLRLSFPASDPVTGPNGPLTTAWRA
ncbi:MAG: cupin domain-containing protein [Acidobacteriaceae bacterium]